MPPAPRTRNRASAAVVAAVVAALMVSGCSARRRGAAPPPGTEGLPSAVEFEASATRRREALRAIRATGRLQVAVDAASDGEVRRRRLSASQSLLARAPDAFRLEALLPFGVGYVVATDGTSIAAFAPSERVLLRGAADLRTVAAATGVAAEPSDVVALLLGVAPVPPLDQARARVERTPADVGDRGDDPAPEALLHATVRDRPDELVVVGFARPAAAGGDWVPVLFERSTIGGDLLLRARFGDFAASPAGPVARRVEIEARGSEATLRWSTFEVNPAFDAAAFTLPTPPGIRERSFAEPATAGVGP